MDDRYNPRDVDPNVRRCVVCSDDINLMTENVYWHSNCMKPIHAECFMNWIVRGEESTTKCLQCFKEEDKDYFIIDIAKQIFDPEFTAQYDVIQELQTRLQQVRAREREIGYVANLAYHRVLTTLDNVEERLEQQMTGPRRLLGLAGFMIIAPFIRKDDFLSDLIVVGTVVVTLVTATFVGGPETALGRRFPGGGRTSRNSLRNSKPKVEKHYLTTESDISNLKKSLTKNVLLCTLDVPDTNETNKIINKCITQLKFKVHESNEKDVYARAEKRMTRLGLHKRSYRPTSRNSRTKRSNKSFTRNSRRRSRKHISNRSATRNSRRNMSRKSLPKWI